MTEFEYIKYQHPIYINCIKDGRITELLIVDGDGQNTIFSKDKTDNIELTELRNKCNNYTTEIKRLKKEIQELNGYILNKGQGVIKSMIEKGFFHYNDEKYIISKHIEQPVEFKTGWELLQKARQEIQQENNTKDSELLKCSRCGQLKPKTEFYKDKQKTRGYQYHCKTCQNEIRKKYPSKWTYKICTKCGERKNIKDFFKQKNGKYGRNSQCKECVKKYIADYKKRKNGERAFKENIEEKPHKKIPAHANGDKRFIDKDRADVPLVSSGVKDRKTRHWWDI